MQIDVANMVAGIVDGLLPRGTEGKGIHVALDVRGNNHGFMVRDGALVPYKDDEEGEEAPDEARAYYTVHFLIYRPTNYTQVYFLKETKLFPDLPSADAPWLLSSDHDSGWRTDGFRDLRDVERSLEKQTTPEGEKGFRLSVYTHKVSFVNMTTVSVLNGKGRERRKITSLSPARGL